MLIHGFDFELAVPATEVGVVTGATIHTKNGLPMRMRGERALWPLPRRVRRARRAGRVSRAF